MGWTDERVEQLKRLWAAGLSASQIAAELGGITRNAVIGKVHRLGLSGRAKAPATTGAAPRPRKARVPSHPMATGSFRSHGNAALARPRMLEAEPAALVELAPAPELVPLVCERVTIMELRECMCRWPLGDPSRDDFRFCGAQTAPGISYCAHHTAKAYQPAADRRRIRVPSR